MSINSDQLRLKIIGFIREEMRWSEEVEIADDADLSSLGIDSLRIITILFRLEDDLGIELLNSDIESCKTFGDVLGLISLVVEGGE